MKKLLSPASMLLAGLLLGVTIRLLDIYTQVLGEIFSQLTVWVLLCSAIAVFSPTPKRAMVNVFPFCAGMLLTYYLTAMATHGVYGTSFILGWSVVSLLAPGLAWIVWFVRKPGLPAKLLAAAIAVTTAGANLVLYGGPRFYDFILLLLLVCLLFSTRADRSQP